MKPNIAEIIYSQFEETFHEELQKMYDSVIKKYDDMLNRYLEIKKEYLSSLEWKMKVEKFEKDLDSYRKHNIISEQEKNDRHKRYLEKEPIRMCNLLFQYEYGLPRDHSHIESIRFQRTSAAKLINRKLFQDTDQLKKYVENEAFNYVEVSKSRLKASILKKLCNLEITACKLISLLKDSQGLEGEWRLTLKDNKTRFFKTQSIIAGGYNIQCIHYRYLSSLSKETNISPFS